MPDDTTILSLPLILPAQAQKHVTHNEALVQLDLIVQLAVINRVLTVAPSVPAIGDRYIVAAGAMGAWVGQDGRIALFAETGWQFTAALPGWQAHVLAEGQTAVFDGLVWETLADGPLTVAELGVSATPDATNRLSVSSPATLLNHAGAGHQLKLNKAASGDTASLLFQTGFGGRAEMGTAGSDDFSVKVSADGSAWAVALEAEAATGEVTLAQPVHLGGQASDPVAPADGTLWLNTTTGEVKVRSAGATAALGGGVSDGDKGDVTVAGGVWTIDAGAVTLGKMASIATDSFLGRDTAGTGAPEVLSPAQARGILNVADGANAYVHPNHSGDVTSTGDGATVIAAGAVTNAKLADMATATFKGRTTAGTGDPEDLTVAQAKTLLNLSGTNSGDQTITLTGDVTGSGTGSFAATIGADAVTNSKLANVATATIKGRATAGTGDPEDLTGTQATALLDTFTSGAKGLVPASGGGTVNFLRADGTFAAPGGGGSPGGATGELQYNNAGAFAGAADAEVEGGQLRLPYIATPATPAAGGVKLYGMDFGPGAPAFLLPNGTVKLIQSDLGDFGVNRYVPVPGSNALAGEHSLNIGALGTLTLAAPAVTRLHSLMPRIEMLVTTASTSAIAGWRNSSGNSLFMRVGKDANAPGGFHLRTLWGPATGVATATQRGFCGVTNWTGAPTDVEPSTRTNIIGMGWDAADANIQFMHNDGSGTATKIDLGASFPVPNADRTEVYEVQLYSPNELTQSVSYRVIKYNTTDKTIAAEATGTVTTNLPAVTSLLAPCGACSVGGTSSVVGVALMGILVAREY